MNRYLKLSAIALIASAALIGCAKIEDNGAIKANAVHNAEIYSKDAPDSKVIYKGDSAQTQICPQGDGWARVDLARAGSGITYLELVCSTYSEDLGCMTKAQFASHPAASQSDHCNEELEYPVKRISK